MARLSAIIPYADDRNLGKAYNEAMEMLPEDGWACLLDHDVMFTTIEWHRQINEIIDKNPNCCFSGVTNRIKCKFQLVENVSNKNHDIKYHREIGEKLLQNKNLKDVTSERNTPSGFIIILSKKAWLSIGKFPNGLHYLDRMIWECLKHMGWKIKIIEGLYLYHWHRGNNEPFQKGEWVEDHTLPDGKIIRLKNRETLPVY